MRHARKLALALSVVFVLAAQVFLLAACGKNPGGQDPQPTPGAVTSVSIKGNADLIFTGEEAELTAEVAGTGNFSKTVRWSSSDEAKATVSDAGVVKAQEVGDVTITATSTADTTKKAERTFSVLPGNAPVNGSFDREEFNWGIYPTDVQNELVTDVVYDGHNALKVSSEINYLVLFHSMMVGTGYMQLKPGGFYVIEAMVYSPTANAGVKPRVLFENVISGENKVHMGEKTAEFVPEANVWTKITSKTVQVPENATAFNAIIELYEAGDIYLDAVRVVEVDSNDTKLATLKADGEDVFGYSHLQNDYTVPVSEGVIPVVTATATDSNTTVSVSQASEENMTAVITVTAQDGTVRTVRVKFIVASSVDLVGITVGGNAVAAFDTDRTDYYMLFARGTTDVPEIGYSKADGAAEVTVDAPATLPGTAVLTVTKDGDSKVYRVALDVVGDDRFSMPYPDTNFDDVSKQKTGWGFDETDISTEQSHSGAYSVKAGANGKGGWLGFSFGTHMDYPVKGDALKAGVWAYVSPADAISGHILVELHEKENGVRIAYAEKTVTAQEAGSWIYVETPVSTAVSEDAGYLQIVVKNYTNSAAYFDDVTLKLGVAAPPAQEEVVDLTALDFGYEGEIKKFEAWGADPQISAEQAKTGSQSLKFDAAAQYSGIKYVITLGEEGMPAAGDKVKFGAWIYIADGTEADQVMVKINFGESYATHSVTALGAAHGQWIYVETNVVTIADGTATLMLVVGNETPGTMTYYVDDLVLTRIL